MTTQTIAGRRPVLEALQAGADIDKILIAIGSEGGSLVPLYAEAKRRGVPVVRASPHKLRALTRAAHQGVVALVSVVPDIALDVLISRAYEQGSFPFVALLDCIEDPHNLGAILRSADGAGAHGVILPKRRSATITDVAIKASAGAALHVPIARVNSVSQAIPALKTHGVWIIGAADDAQALYMDADYNRPCAIVLGSEGYGLHRTVRAACDHLVRIPMFGRVSSLNVSVAAGLLFYEVARQRMKE